MNVYSYEVGILLSEDDEEFSYYSCVYDKKYGYYDEDQAEFIDKEKAIKYARQYVEEGVDGTYGVICDQGDIYDGDIEEFNEYDTTDFNYSVENVIYSVMKKDGKIIENFIKTY